MYYNNNANNISKSTLINTLKNIHMALVSPRYIFNSFYNGHIPLLNQKNAQKNDIFAPTPFGNGRVIWHGWSVQEFENYGVNIAFNKANFFKNGLSLRVNPRNEIGYITIDDIDDEIKFKHAKKYDFALKIKTSANSYQGVLKINLPNKNREAEIFALRETAQILNHGFGDKEVRSSSQIFRFPNTYNNKEKHKSAEYPYGYMVKLCAAENVFCAKAQKLFDSILKQIEKNNYIKFLDKYNKVKNKTKVNVYQNLLGNVGETQGKTENYSFVVPTKDDDFKPLFAESGEAWQVYYAQAHYLYYEYKKRGKKPLQGRFLDDFVATRLKILGYNKEDISLILSTSCYGKNAELRAKDTPDKIKTYQSRTKLEMSQIGQKVTNNVYNDNVLIEYSNKFKAKNYIVEECKKKEIYWCKRFCEEQETITMKM